MKLSRMIQILIVSFLLAIATTSTQAAKGGKGGGKGGGGEGGGGGGSGFDTPVQAHLTITFRDTVGDGVQSDGNPYYDAELGLDSENVDAHIDTSAGSNYGNLYLRTTSSVSRTLYLDITDCIADCENQPFTADYFHSAAFTVAATHSISGGFCGMAQDQVITAPMQIWYNLPGIEHPGFVFFEPGVKGKSPCRGNNGSSEVTVVRTSATSWIVSGDAACVVAPYDEPGGVVFMPFEFTADADDTCQ